MEWGTEMTVAFIGTIQNWLGLSTDTKPTSPPVGSTFIETDTGATYLYDSSAWVLKREGLLLFATKTVTFDGTANLGQAGSNTTLFTVTGEVLIEAIVPFCTTLLTEALATATVSLGVTGNVTLWNAATNSVDIDANEFWVSTVPDANGVTLGATYARPTVITDDILVAAATQDTNAGVIRFDVYWKPLSSDGLLVAA